MQAKGWRLPAHEIEQLVLNAGGLVPERPRRGARRPALKAEVAGSGFCCAHARCEIGRGMRGGSLASQAEIVAALVRRVTVAQDKVTIEIGRKALAARLLDQEAAL